MPLTSAQEEAIRKLYAAKSSRYDWNVSRLAREFRTSPARVREIVREIPRGKMFTGFPASDLTSTAPYIED